MAGDGYVVSSCLMGLEVQEEGVQADDVVAVGKASLVLIAAASLTSSDGTTAAGG